MNRVFFGACLASVVALASAAATFESPSIDLPRQRTVVVLGRGVARDEYSHFFATLERLGSVAVAAAADVKLKVFEEYQYDNAVVLGNPGKVAADLIDFVDAGNNVMVVASSDGTSAGEYLCDELRAVAVDLGAEFTQTPVADPFGSPTAPDLITTDKFVKSKPLIGATTPPAVKYLGLGLQVEEFNPLVIQVLSATSTSYVNDEAVVGKLYGANIGLVTAIQTRVGSRGVLVGGSALLADKYWASNGAFVTRLTEWAQQRHGVLRQSAIDYFKLTEDGEDDRDGDMFRIGQHIRFSMTIEEYDGATAEWVPYAPPADDPVQVEWTMLDPYVRADLKQVGKTHTADMQAPDKYGVFKFVVDHRRVGYTPLVVHHQCPIRPMRMNEYERFLVAAYPYYLGTFSAMAGLALMGAVYLPLLSGRARTD